MALTLIENTTERTNVATNITNAPQAMKDKYDYFWLAKLSVGSDIFQFNSSGVEQSYSLVKTQIDATNVTDLYWIPVDASRNCVGTTIVGGDTFLKGFGMWRRGSINLTTGKQTFFYIIGLERSSTEECVFINYDSNKTQANDKDFDFMGWVAANPLP